MKKLEIKNSKVLNEDEQIYYFGQICLTAEDLSDNENLDEVIKILTDNYVVIPKSQIK